MKDYFPLGRLYILRSPYEHVYEGVEFFHPPNTHFTVTKMDGDGYVCYWHSGIVRETDELVVGEGVHSTLSLSQLQDIAKEFKQRT